MTAPPLEPGVYGRDATGEWPDAEGVPSPDELRRAAELVAGRLGPTPTEPSKALSRRYGRDILVKLENVTPIRSFKVRGALASVAMLADGVGARGVVTASTGNHGQGVAFAARELGIAAAVAVPGSTAPVKRRAMEELGATMLDGGASLSESEDVARSYAEETGARYVEDGDDRWLMAGAATVVGELLESAGDLDAVLVPVGGGNLVASALLAAALRAHRVEVIGVQSSAATGVTRSWLARRMLESRCDTFAAGLATARPGRASLAVLDAALRRMVVVDDDDLWNAIPVAYDALGLPVEAAGAAGIAALERFNEQITGRRVAVVVTGGRIDARELADALTGKRRHAVTPGRAPGRAGPV